MHILPVFHLELLTRRGKMCYLIFLGGNKNLSSLRWKTIYPAGLLHKMLYLHLASLIQRKCLLQTLPTCFLTVDLLINHYGVDRPAEAVQGDEYIKQALISPELWTEWKTFHRYLSQQSKVTLNSQLTTLTTNEILKTMFPNRSTLANICLAIPVGTASVERSFS